MFAQHLLPAASWTGDCFHLSVREGFTRPQGTRHCHDSVTLPGDEARRSGAQRPHCGVERPVAIGDELQVPLRAALVRFVGKGMCVRDPPTVAEPGEESVAIAVQGLCRITGYDGDDNLADNLLRIDPLPTRS